MTGITFDTLDYFEKLKDAGVPEAQAKVQVEVMQSVVQNYDAASRKELATKGDVQAVKADLHAVRTELKQDIQALDNKINDTKHELMKWITNLIVALFIAQSALFVGIMAFMK